MNVSDERGFTSGKPEKVELEFTEMEKALALGSIGE